MSSASRSSLPLSEKNSPRAAPACRAAFGSRALAIGWESISGLLFATAVSPAVVARPWPSLIFVASLGVSALLAPWLATEGRAKYWALDLLRAVAWALALLPVVELTGERAMWERALSVSWPPA